MREEAAAQPAKTPWHRFLAKALPEGATMQEILTPERVMVIGEEWKQISLTLPHNRPPLL